jgi:hypothetical protein
MTAVQAVHGRYKFTEPRSAALNMLHITTDIYMLTSSMEHTGLYRHRLDTQVLGKIKNSGPC